MLNNRPNESLQPQGAQAERTARTFPFPRRPGAAATDPSTPNPSLARSSLSGTAGDRNAPPFFFVRRKPAHAEPFSTGYAAFFALRTVGNRTPRPERCRGRPLPGQAFPGCRMHAPEQEHLPDGGRFSHSMQSERVARIVEKGCRKKYLVFRSRITTFSRQQNFNQIPNTLFMTKTIISWGTALLMLCSGLLTSCNDEGGGIHPFRA